MADINLTQLEEEASPAGAVVEEATPLAAEVLVVGLDDWAIAEAAAQLVAAGRKVHRCADSVEAPFPCNALVEGRGCPLDVHDVDVVLDIHSQPRSRLPFSEMGAVCGLRDGLPLVVGGLADESILDPWAEQVPSDSDIVSTCDAAVAKARRSAATRRR
jgi:hypothetical protein